MIFHKVHVAINGFGPRLPTLLVIEPPRVAADVNELLVRR